MVQRCSNPSHQAYDRYGGRGITICDRWLRSFYLFYQDMGDSPEGTSLDRIKVNEWYAKENCRWADAVTQANNKRSNGDSEDSEDPPF